MKKVILFDLDGTLTQTYYAQDTSYYDALKALIGDFSHLTQDKTGWHFTDEFMFHFLFDAQLGRKASAKEYGKMQQMFLARLEQKKKVDPSFFDEIAGAKNFISEIEKNDAYDYAIVTGGWNYIAKYKLEHIGVIPQSYQYFGSDIAPKKEDGIVAAKHMFVQKHGPETEFLYIGDSLHDKKSAAKTSTPFLGMDFNNQNLFSGEHAHPFITHYHEHDKIWDAFEN